MYYYADGDQSLIRVHVGPEPPTATELYAALAQRYVGVAHGGWIESPSGLNLGWGAVWSGDYYPVDDAEARRVMAIIDADRRRGARETALRKSREFAARRAAVDG